MRLNAIRIVGAKSTRPGFLAKLFAPYLPTIPSASYLDSSRRSPSSDPSPQTLRSLLGTTRELSALLAKFDLFTTVDASLENTPSLLAEKEDVDIVLRVKEMPRFYLRTATDVGDGEGTAVRPPLVFPARCTFTHTWINISQTGTARIRNAFGGGETVEGNVSFGTRTKSAFQVSLCLA